jgi:crotonobetainyl-CoA:carnitine CoA-transferase CaiB-like acyl-CoA transferase
MIENTGTGHELPGPLQGVRIVECAVWHAGPGASAILADMGAEVIKVETLAGDPERAQKNLGAVNFEQSSNPDWSFMFELSNRNKRGICLDIHSNQGRTLFNRLLETADVFLTNLRNETKPKWGIDYESVRKINPRIIHANVSGFGPRGKMRNVGAFDPMGQAISGMVFLTGPNEPVLLQAVILDQMTAIAASHAMLAALFVRERHGIGQEVHVSLYSSALWLMHSNLLATGILKSNPIVEWDRSKNSPLRNCFKCKDGKWVMGTNHPEDKFWKKFCDITGQSGLADDPRYNRIEVRSKHSAELMDIFNSIFLMRTRDEWVSLLQENGLMFAPVQDLDEVLVDPQALENGYVVDFDHPTLGKVKLPGFPIHFSENKAGTHGAAPALGQDTDQVLTELGCTLEEIDSLHAGNIVK